MTVKELAEVLKGFNDDSRIWIATSNGINPNVEALRVNEPEFPESHVQDPNDVAPGDLVIAPQMRGCGPCGGCGPNSPPPCAA